MNWMVLPNQVCLIVKLYNNRPELLPDSNDPASLILSFANICTKNSRHLQGHSCLQFCQLHLLAASFHRREA